MNLEKRTIILHIAQKNVVLLLRDKGVTIDQDQWIDRNNLLEEFFPRYRALLESNSLFHGDITEYLLETDLPSGLTMIRIAKTVVATLNFASQD